MNVNSLEIIRNVFNDKRDMFEIERNLFLLDNTEGIVNFQVYFGDITPKALAEITEECENLWKKFGLPIYNYILIDSKSKVKVPEHMIQSEADFTIKISVMQEDPIQMMFNIIEEKILNNQITEMDINILHILPMMAKDEDRLKIRTKTNELLSKIMQ